MSQKAALMSKRTLTKKSKSTLEKRIRESITHQATLKQKEQLASYDSEIEDLTKRIGEKETEINAKQAEMDAVS